MRYKQLIIISLLFLLSSMGGVSIRFFKENYFKKQPDETQIFLNCSGKGYTLKTVNSKNCNFDDLNFNIQELYKINNLNSLILLNKQLDSFYEKYNLEFFKDAETVASKLESKLESFAKVMLALYESRATHEHYLSPVKIDGQDYNVSDKDFECYKLLLNLAEAISELDAGGSLNLDEARTEFGRGVVYCVAVRFLQDDILDKIIKLGGNSSNIKANTSDSIVKNLSEDVCESTLPQRKGWPLTKTERDAQRVTDLQLARFTLESYYEKFNFYPKPLIASKHNWNSWCGLRRALIDKNIDITDLGTDPGPGAPDSYQYGVSENRQNYVLAAFLNDKNNPVLKDSVHGLINGINCDNSTYCLTDPIGN